MYPVSNAKTSRMRNQVLSLFLFISILSTHAQTVLENNPPSVKWYQVVTPNFRVLYSDGFEKEAQRVANSLEQVRDAGAQVREVRQECQSAPKESCAGAAGGVSSVTQKGMGMVRKDS